MDTTLTDTVFTAAAQATRWTSTNLGPRTEIAHCGYTWTVELPAEGQGNARITGRYGYGGTELLDIPATPGQTVGIVEAAVSALRAPAGTSEPGKRWEVEDFGEVIGSHPSEDAAKAQVRELLLIDRANPQQITVEWTCLCEGAGECSDCQSGETREQFAHLQAEGCARVSTRYSVRPAA